MTMMLLLAALGCKKDAEDTAVGDDTSVDDTSVVDDTGEEACQVKPSEFAPEDEASEVYYRTEMSVAFTGAVSTATFELALADGTKPMILEEQWGDPADRVTLLSGTPLEPESDYALSVTVCGQTYVNTFSTSFYGKPLDVGPEELVERSYLIKLEDVKFVKPDNVATLIKTFLDMPILVNVQTVDGQDMTLVGAEGWIDSSGGVNQRKRRDSADVPTWDFEGVDFSQPPYFKADSPGIVLVYDGIEIPVYDFHLEGTFAADASSLGGGRLWGLADTRDTAPLLNESDPNHVCDLVASFGAECEPCPDGEVYCLFLQGEDITAEEVEVLNTFERITLEE